MNHYKTQVTGRCLPYPLRLILISPVTDPMERPQTISMADVKVPLDADDKFGDNDKVISEVVHGAVIDYEVERRCV